jgi:hypothetical protein
MAVPQITGQYLIDLSNDLLGGYQGSVDSRALMSYINEAKDEIWSVIKELKDEYFQVFSQSTNSTGDFYFPQLVTSTRQYTLPEDLRSIQFIEITTAGYTDIEFRFAPLNSDDFREARKQSNTLGGPDPTNNVDEIIYTIAGKDQFILASYPPANLSVTLWYTRALPDYEMSDIIDEILCPYSKKIADFASQRVMLVADPAAFTVWKTNWRDGLINVTQAAAQRNDSDPVFVQEFWGDE